MRPLVVLLMALPLSAQQTKRPYPPIHACGITAHALFDGKPLGTLEQPLRDNILTALKPRILAEAKVADVIDPNQLSLNQLNQSLLVTELNPAQPNPVYAIMWEERQICGSHENCAWWVVRQDSQHLTVLSDTTQKPQIGWAAGTQRTLEGNEVLLGISSSELRREATCMELKDNQLVRVTCAPNCAIENHP
jgi:hypothetical protein